MKPFTKSAMRAKRLPARFIALTVAVACTSVSLPAIAAPGEAAGCPNVNPKLPISVAADESEFQKKDSRVLLRGSVTIDQGVLHLAADEVVITYLSGDTRDMGSQGTVTSLVATGTVKFECEGDRAHGRIAHYNVAQRNIELSGDVLLVRGGNILKGESLFIDLDTGYTTIRGGQDQQSPGAPAKDTRIKAVFSPPQESDTVPDEEPATESAESEFKETETDTSP